MLNSAVHWMLIVATVADFILLLRIVQLKLHRFYAFITLDAALGLLFDSVGWWLGWDSREYTRVFFYSRFLYAALVQAIAWDVFEEVTSRVSKIRRVASLRLRAGLVSTGLLAVLLWFTLASGDAAEGPEPVYFTATLLWGSSCLTSLIFMWKVSRAMSLERIERPHNTRVWTRFYWLSFSISLANCALLLTGLHLNSTASAILNLVFATFELGLVGWCVLRLRAHSQDTLTVIGKIEP